MDKFTYDKCKICGLKNVSPAHFWKEHHFKEADYCMTYEKRVSKLTGAPIRFKNRDFYFASDFNDKNELKKWIKENPEEAKRYAIEFLEKRFWKGKSIYAPCQVELRSLCSPNVIWYQNEFGYNTLCASIGMNTRFIYNFDVKELEIPFTFKGKIIIDTREQRPLIFKKQGLETVRKKLDYGDYAIEAGFNTHIFIERKSLTDFITTLSSNFPRFCREIDRAQANNHYLIVLVEAPINDALAFNRLPHVSSKIKASPEYVFHRVRDLMQKYNNIQFLFADGREQASDLVQKIYSLSIDPAKYDLQYLLDKKLI